MAIFAFLVERDFPGALSEFQQAEQGVPNNADVIEADCRSSNGGLGIGTRQLPSSAAWLSLILVASTPRGVSRLRTGCCAVFQKLSPPVDRVRAVGPDESGSALYEKWRSFWRRVGDLHAAEPLLSSQIRARSDFACLVCPLFQRRYAAAIGDTLLKRSQTETDRDARSIEKLLLGFCLSQQRARRCRRAARATYQDAAQDLKRQLETAAPDFSFAAGLTHALLGGAYAGLGETVFAIAEGQKVWPYIRLLRIPLRAPTEETMAEICLLGDADHAIPILNDYCRYSYPVRSPLDAASRPSGIKFATILVFRNWWRKRNLEQNAPLY